MTALTVTFNLLVETDDGHIIDEPVEFPAHYEVCDTCRGNGKHVNRAIDGNGLDPHDPDLDEDFWEGYFDGRYDVTCEQCNGNRVVPVMDDEDTLSPELKAQLVKLEEQWEDERYSQAEQDAERRMGA